MILSSRFRTKSHLCVDCAQRLQADTEDKESDDGHCGWYAAWYATADSEEKLASRENGSAATADANDVAAEGKTRSQCLYRP